MPKHSLWGELPSRTKKRTPRSLLEEQGEILSHETNEILRGYVVFSKREPGGPMSGYDRERPFDVRFGIVAPLLDGYSYEVLSVSHGVTLYPALVHSEVLPGGERRAANEEEFLSVVEKILTSDSTRTVISALLAQSEDASEDSF